VDGILAETGLAPSKREAGRLIKQGGVKCDGAAVTDADGAAPEVNTSSRSGGATGRASWLAARAERLKNHPCRSQ
jgi:tyrosyl-tRNA synthetase